MMASDTGVGVIGAGYWGKNLVRNFARLGVLRAVADVDPQRLAALAADYPSVVFLQQPESLLSRDDIHAVAIATPAVTHAGMVGLALRADKHVFVEKPLCLDVGEAQQLRDEAASRDLRLMVGHVLLYHPAFVALRQCLDEGRLGGLRYIYSNRLSLGKIRREENALWSFAPHDISMILQLTGSLPATVTAVGGQYLHPGVADTTLSHMEFAGDVQAHVFVSWLHPFKDHRLVVVGDRAMAVFDDGQPQDDKLSLFEHDVGWSGEVPVVNKATAERVNYVWEEPLFAEVQSFLLSVQTGFVPPSDADEGIRVLKVLRACQDALVTGQRAAVGDGA